MARIPFRGVPLAAFRRCRHLLSSSAAAAAAVASTSPASSWTEAPLAAVAPATADASLFHVSVDLSASPYLLASHLAAGQFVSLRIPTSSFYPIYLAIASPPPSLTGDGSRRSEFQFLVKRVPGTPSDLLCGLRAGDAVEVGGVAGRGFDIGRITQPEMAASLLIFATGSGISPIRSLIESGFTATTKADVKLFYGTRNLERMAYQV